MRGHLAEVCLSFWKASHTAGLAGACETSRSIISTAFAGVKNRELLDAVKLKHRFGESGGNWQNFESGNANLPLALNLSLPPPHTMSNDTAPKLSPPSASSSLRGWPSRNTLGMVHLYRA